MFAGLAVRPRQPVGGKRSATAVPRAKPSEFAGPGLHRGVAGAGFAERSFPRQKPVRVEDELQEEIVAYHASAVDQRHAITFAVPNGEKRDPATAARLTGMSALVRDCLPEECCLRPAGLGVLPGVSDLVVLLPRGRVVLVEVKIPKILRPAGGLALAMAAGRKLLEDVLHRAGVLSKAQKRFRDGSAALGHDYRVIRSVEAYADLLEELGVPLRCRPWGPGVAAPRPPVGFRLKD